MAAQETWARAANAKGPEDTGPVAQHREADAQNTPKHRPDTALPGSLRRRREASYRLPPMACGHRDPLECVAFEWPVGIGPHRYGLTFEQARRHGNELVTTWGWSVGEVVEVLGIEPKAA